MKLKSLLSTIITACLTISFLFTFNSDIALAAGTIHNGDKCFSNDYEGEWVIGDIPGYGAPETKICIRGKAEKSCESFSVSKGDYCYEKSEDNKSYLSNVIEKDGIYGCGYSEPEYLPSTFNSTLKDSVKDSCVKIGGAIVYEDELVVDCQIYHAPAIYGLFSPFEEACAEAQGAAHSSIDRAICFY
ncbi:hypothetical protein [Dapis sp. BLCC M229]|uniref:hypothetical protein n=1 Tax=Dapis sp. BLCC M229 TaxID=3400188 RepID=UPI003CFA8ADA